MLAKVDTACLTGLEGCRVRAEVSLAKGLPSFSIVGLPDASVREAKDRVFSAIRNSGFEFPERRVTVNLSPADVKKEGSLFDVAIAVGVLLASESVNLPRWPRCIWMGELALDGSIQPVRGCLPLVRSLFEQGWRDFVLPTANVAEVSFLPDIRLFAFSRLLEVAEWLEDKGSPRPIPAAKPWSPVPGKAAVDLSEIKGQSLGKRALEIAAAGHHNLLFMGCPGTGKSLLAQALPCVLPSWDLEQALEASQIHSASGLLNGSGLLTTRPFRTPHHTISPSALIGGGDTPMPGEISLAHCGILFLDELPEFRRDALEALRQPLEEGVVHLQRVRGRATYPSEFLLIAAMNPCPCGYRGHPKRECRCSPARIQKYLSRISGPFLDRIDLQVEIPVLRTEELFSEGSTGEPSEEARKRVELARAAQAARLGHRPKRRAVNACLRGHELRRNCGLDAAGKDLLKAAVERLGLSARSFDRVRRVARTIADMEGSEAIQARHLAEAIQFRAFDRQTTW